MLSHCCARCGLNLDAPSRQWSAALRMWIAACPRCGFSVAWSPRRAREGARVWSRLRALNLRLGIALSSGQLAAVPLLVVLGSVSDQPRSFGPWHPGILVAWLIASVLVAISAVALAPGRSRVLAALVSWMTVVVPTFAAIAALLSLANPPDLGRRMQNLQGQLDSLGAALAASIVLSCLLAPALGGAHELLRKEHARRDRRAKRAAIGSPMGTNA